MISFRSLFLHKICSELPYYNKGFCKWEVTEREIIPISLKGISKITIYQIVSLYKQFIFCVKKWKTVPWLNRASLSHLMTGYRADIMWPTLEYKPDFFSSVLISMGGKHVHVCILHIQGRPGCRKTLLYCIPEQRSLGPYAAIEVLQLCRWSFQLRLSGDQDSWYQHQWKENGWRIITM